MQTSEYVHSHTSAERIERLLKGEIFVFGSNLQGMHGGGAARTALERFGAVWGQGTGLQGQSYAIPTMHGGPEAIRPYVDEFISFARQHKELTFLVTEIGCGLAGYEPADIAPLFEEAAKLPNVRLPRRFWNVLISKPIDPNDPEVQRLLKLTKEQQEKTKALQKIDPNTGKLTITI